MKRVPFFLVTHLLVLATAPGLGGRALAQSDPLPSWNDRAAKKAIVAFVHKTAIQRSPDFVPPAERIAAFDAMII